MVVVNMPIHKRVQHPRNNTAIVNGYIGLAGEIVIDRDRWEMRLHDGVKKGGHRFLSSTALSTIFLGVDSEAGKLKFSGGSFGFVVRTTDQLYKIRSLIAEDGIRLVNPKGIDANPIIGLPARLAATSTNYAVEGTAADVDLILDSGFYALNANSLHIPTGIADVAASTLVVIRRSTTEATQLIVSVQNTGNAWIRAMVSGSWQNWVVLKADEGTDELLEAGTDNVQRTWTAKQLAEFITDRLKDIATEDVGGTVKSYGGSQKKFKDKWSGPGIGDKTFGPYGTPSDEERWIIYGSGTPKVERQGGSSGTDRLYDGGVNLEVEIDGKWEVAVANAGFYATPGDRNPDAINYSFRLQYDAAVGNEKMLICNGDWVTTKTLDGEWSGKFKFSTGTKTTEMSVTGFKLKLKT